MSYTTGTLATTLRAIRCAHRCLESGRGIMLCELSPDHEQVTVTALQRRESGYRLVTKCEKCGGWNGVNYVLRQAA